MSRLNSRTRLPVLALAWACLLAPAWAAAPANGPLQAYRGLERIEGAPALRFPPCEPVWPQRRLPRESSIFARLREEWILTDRLLGRITGAAADAADAGAAVRALQHHVEHELPRASRTEPRLTGAAALDRGR